MSKENRSTILNEHRTITVTRHVLALLNFIAIFVGTLITIIFASRRGCPTGVLACLYLLMITNLVQIGLCVADYVLKQFFGMYVKWLVPVNYSFGGLWILLLIAEIIAGTVELSAMRTDLLIIAAIQLVVALAAYIIWPALDRRAVDSMIRPSVRDDAEKRSKKCKLFIRCYVVLCAIVVLAQAGLLLIYKLPPRIYDIFADTRAVEYVPSEDGEGYVVVGIYQGTSSSVEIPATYNNKPVVGIASGALVDEDILEKYRVSSITLGTYEKDENGDTVLVSNLRYIEEGAISNHKITSLTVPSSVTRISEGAIVSDSLKTLQYEASADFNYGILNCSSLSTISMSGDSVGKIVSLNGMGSGVSILVSKDIYNAYRRSNPAYLTNFRPILDEGEFVVDFYTDCDYYLESIFGNEGSKVELSYLDLVSSESKGTSPAVDTKAYIEDAHELGTDGAKTDSAFRGWYFDSSFVSECTFPKDGKISFSANTALYARWIDEYRGTLDWSTYTPTGESTVIYWTDEDIISLPVITGRLGYEEGIRWWNGENVVTDTSKLANNAALQGEWILDKPTVGLGWEIVDGSGREQGTSTYVNFVFDESRNVVITGERSHVLDGANPAYSYEWRLVENEEEAILAEKSNVQTLRNVKDSGTYRLYVTVTSPYGETATNYANITVSVAKKDIDIGTVEIKGVDYVYNGLAQTIECEGQAVTPSVIIEYEYVSQNGETSYGANGAKNAGAYTVRATLVVTGAEASNYNTHTLSANFKVKPKELAFDGWYLDNVKDSDSVVYDSTTHKAAIKFLGWLQDDDQSVAYLSSGSTVSEAKNAGQYLAVLSGIKNGNYAINLLDEELYSYEWAIEKKEVTVSRWQLDGVNNSDSVIYDGREHAATALMDGKVTGDSVSFIYAQTETFVYSAKNVGNYTARAVDVDNPNYVFYPTKANSSYEFDWTITQRKLSVSFSSNTSFYYNGEGQGPVATVSNFGEGDAVKFTADYFVYLGSSEALSVACELNADSNLEIAFRAVNADTYTASISALASSAVDALLNNYYLDLGNGLEKQFTVSPKTISFTVSGSYIYSGAEQDLIVRVAGILEKDLAGVTFSQFTTTAAEGRISGSDYQLVYRGMDAKTYAVSVTGFDSDNYTMESYQSSVRIAPKTLTVGAWSVINNRTNEISTASEFAYNFEGYTVTASVSGLTAADEGKISFTLNGATQQNVGSYTTTASLSATYSNYSFAGATFGWQITPYVLDITWTESGKTVDFGTSGLSYVFDGTQKTLTPSVTPLGTDSVTIRYESGDTISALHKGVYSVHASIDDGNYVLGKNAEFSWTITARTLTVNWTIPEGLVYNGQYQGPSFTLSGFVGDFEASQYVAQIYCLGLLYTNDSLNQLKEITLSGNTTALVGENGVFIDAGGNYTVSFNSFYEKDGTKNYYDYNVVNSGNTAFGIARKTLTLTGVWTYANGGKTAAYATDTVLTYNKSQYTLTTAIQEGGLVKRLNSSSYDSVTLSYTQNTATNAGTYTASASIAMGNYVLSTQNLTCTWEISPKAVTVVWNGVDANGKIAYTYTSQSFTVTATYNTVTAATSTASDGKVISGDTLTYTYSGNTGVNAANYTATVTAWGNTNYVIDSTCNNSHAWTVNPATAQIQWSATSFVYDGTAQAPTASYKVLSSSSWSSFGAVYTSVNSVTNGSYTISIDTAKSSLDSNYTFTGSSNLSCTYQINARPVTLSWYFEGGAAVSNFTYDGTAHTLLARVTNLCGSDSVTLAYENNTGIKNAGNYTAKVTGLSGNSNYTLTGVSTSVTSCSVTVTPRLLTVEWRYDGVAGQKQFTYDGKDHEVTAVPTNLCTGDSINQIKYVYTQKTSYGSMVSPYNKTSAAGTYTITVNIDIGNNNYTVSGTSSADLVIARKTITQLTWSNATATYDKLYHNAIANVPASQLISGETVNVDQYTVAGVSGTVSATQQAINVGTYTISASGIDNTNYVLGSNLSNGTVTINPKPVTVTWEDETKTYDGAPHSLTASFEGVCAGDTVTATEYYRRRVSSYGEESKTGNSSYFAGSYEISVVSISNANYTVSNPNTVGKLVINPLCVKELVWSYTAINVKYDGKAHGNAVSRVRYTYNLNDTFSYTYNMIDLSTGKSVGANTYVTDAGEYKLCVVDVGNTNYYVDESTTDWYKLITITPATVSSVQWKIDANKQVASSVSWVYTGIVYTVSCTLASSIDTLAKFSVQLEGDVNPVNVGTYTYTITDVGNSNYTMDGYTGSNKTFEVKIQQAEAKLNWDLPTNAVYDGTSKTFSVTVAALGNDVVNVTYVLKNESGEIVDAALAAGTYTVEVTGIDNGNYALPITVTQKFVIAAS